MYVESTIYQGFHCGDGIKNMMEQKKEGNAGDSYQPKGTVNLTAHWVERKQNQIELAFIDATGETKYGIPNPIIIYNDDTEVKSVTTPEISDYDNWNLRKYWTRSTEPTGEKVADSQGTISNVTENATYYAIYEKEIAITYNTNDGAGDAPNTETGVVKVNSNNLTNITTIQITLPDGSGITKPGYDFVGWNTQKDGKGDTYTGKVNFSESMTMYAQWEANTSTITINPGEGGKVKVKSPSNANEEEINASKTYTQNSNTALVYDLPTKSNEIDTNTKYTVTYNTDGGSAAPEKQEATVTKITRYTFKEWTKSEGFKGTLNEENRTYTFPTVKDNTDTITATYTSNVNSSVSPVELRKAPTKIGYTFEGWKSSTDDSKIYEAGENYTPTGNTTMTAQWKLKDIKFEDKILAKTFSTTNQIETNAIDVATGGTGEYTYEIIEGNSDEYFAINGRDLEIKANTPANISGYEITIKATDSISGATASAKYTIKINKANMTAPQVTIDAEGKVTWTAVTGATSYQIKFDNGEWSNATTEDATSGSKTISKDTTGTKTVAVIAISEDGNYNTPSEEGTASKEVYSLKLKKGTGISSVSGEGNYVEGKEVSIDATVSTGYTWSKWIKNSGATPTDINTKNTTVTISENTELEAEATINQYTATFDSNEGSEPNPKTIKKDYNSELGELPTTSREGYTFEGWFTEKTGGTKITSETKLTSDITYYAQWSRSGYTIEYYKGNTKLGSSSHAVGQAKNLTTISTLDGNISGYDFYGWTKTEDALTRDYEDSEQVTDLASSGQTLKLYAIYSKEITVTYYITADNPSTDTETKTQYYNPNGSTTSLSVTLSDVTAGKKENIFDGWNNSSGSKVGNSGDSISVTENMEITSRWKHIDESAISAITVTKSGTQLTFNNIPDDVTINVWTPTRYLPDKQINPLWCQRNDPNLVLDATHNTTQSYISKTDLPSTYTDIYMDVRDKNGNIIYTVRYCDLTTATSGTFAETDYQGELYVYSVSLVKNSNINTNGTPKPTIQSNGKIDFDLSFKITTSGSPTYSASYEITIINDTSQDFEFYYPTYRPTAYLNTGSKKKYYNDNIFYTITEINPGDKILSGESKVVKVNYAFVDPLQTRNANGYIFLIDKDGPVDITDNIQEDKNTRLTAKVQDTEGDLTGTNTRAAYTVQVTNEFDVSKSFSLSVKETEKFVLVDANGNENPEYTILPGEEDKVYTFYLQKVDGAEFAVSTQRPTIVFTLDNSDSINIGMVTALVDVNTAVVDIEPPEISNVKLELSNTQGEATVTWNGTDTISGVVKDYYIYLYKQDKQDGTKVSEFSTGNDNTTMNITGLQENETYYVTVFGEDAFENMPDASTISAANTVYAVKSSTIEARWVFNVDIKATNVTYPNNTPKTVNRGDNYSVTFTRSEDTWSKYEATMGGKETNVSFDNTKKTSEMLIRNVTGDLVITVTSSGNCLAEGTPILLADGTYKNIEDVTYTDLLRVYNHVTGEMSNIYPIWIEKESVSNKYEKITFSDGTEIKFVGTHCIFSIDSNKFVNVTDSSECKIGTRVYKVNNDKLEEATITNIEYIDEEVKYYHVVSAIQYNVIVNGFITVDPFAALSNIYGFKENATYSNMYDIISNFNQLSYEDCKFAPHYIFKGVNLKNAGQVFGKLLDANYFSNYISEKGLEPITKDGKLYFMMTTSLDDWNSRDKEKYLHEEGSTYKLPETGADYFIETSTGTRYEPGDTVTVDYSMHFEAVKNTTTILQNSIRAFLQNLLSMNV